MRNNLKGSKSSKFSKGGRSGCSWFARSCTNLCRSVYLIGNAVKELKHRQADNLAAKMAEVNNEKKLCRVSPGSTVVAKWIQQANSLEKAIRY